ncbi:MAG: MBL fold metallo-hydrolase [Lentisphaeria bacterium]|nr:MBL fold metallo-hydrolase [Lentisphaeria bacterium]
MNTILNTFSELAPEKGSLAVCRLGQHSFLVKGGNTLIAIDPYLNNNPKRLIPPLINAEEFAGIDLILCTHDHSDHIDRVSLAAMAKASPDALFIFPEAVRRTITEIPAERIIGINDGEELEIDDIIIRGIASAHEFLDRSDNGLYPYLGYVISMNDVCFYHSGDCCVYDGLAALLKDAEPDLMMLPINGRDAKRYAAGCIGNMTYQEAADLAGWCWTKCVIPAHYDMFPGNTEDPQLFLDYMNVKYPQIKAEKLVPGEIRILKINR